MRSQLQIYFKEGGRLKTFFFSLFFLGVCLCLPHAVLASENSQYNLLPLYNCISKLESIGAKVPQGYELGILKQDLLYILDEDAPELYVYTPSYVGASQLSHDLKQAIRTKLEQKPITANPFPFTPCCQHGVAVNIRIPYKQRGGKTPEGYFYMNLEDPTPMTYDEVYYGADHKMHVKRHDQPMRLDMTNTPHSMRVFGLVRYLKGAPQETPDFSNYKPKTAANAITVLSVEGQPKSGVTYNALETEQQILASGTPHVSRKAVGLLHQMIAYGLQHLLPIHRVGQRADCWGHLGCDYTYTQEEVAAETKAQQEANNACSELPMRRARRLP